LAGLGKKDVDFILETPEGIVGLEIKTSQTVTANNHHNSKTNCLGAWLKISCEY